MSAKLKLMTAMKMGTLKAEVFFSMKFVLGGPGSSAHESHECLLCRMYLLRAMVLVATIVVLVAT